VTIVVRTPTMYEGTHGMCDRGDDSRHGYDGFYRIEDVGGAVVGRGPSVCQKNHMNEVVLSTGESTDTCMLAPQRASYVPTWVLRLTGSDRVWIKTVKGNPKVWRCIRKRGRKLADGR
jgi:hypothetical protein